jgi:hypothetical protein
MEALLFDHHPWSRIELPHQSQNEPYANVHQRERSVVTNQLALAEGEVIRTRATSS